MSIAQKFEIVADAVYKKGISDGLCDAEIFLTNNFRRQSYIGVFSESDWSGYSFSQTVYPVTNVEKMFYAYAGTELPGNIDFSKLETNKGATYYRNMFGWAAFVKEIPDMNIPAIPYYQNTYSNCESLEKIELIRSGENTVFTNPFANCAKLTTVNFEGVIANHISFADCPKLSLDSLKSIISCLKDYSGTNLEYTRTLTLSADSINTLSSESGTWLQYIDNKKWNLS